MSDTDRVAIVGIGETAPCRRSDRSAADLLLEAVRAAIEDAGLQPHDIDGFVSSASQAPADHVAAALGAPRAFTLPVGYVAGAGTVGAAVLNARLAIQAGLAKTVLVYFCFKGSREGGPYASHAADPLKASLELPFGWYGQPVYFAAWAQRYCHDFGVKPAEFAPVAMASRAWAALSPGAQAGIPITEADYQRSPMIATPLRRLDCCLITDGAAAYVVTSLPVARHLRQPPAVVTGIGVASLDTPLSCIFTQNSDLPSFAATQSGQIAYREAGLGPADIDLAQVYDCFSISQILQMEELGFCRRGEGFAVAADGRIGPGGSLSINTNGGHLSYSYLPGMTHVIEAVRQLRGARGAAQVPEAEVALVAGLGGNDHGTLILTKDR